MLHTLLSLQKKVENSFKKYRTLLKTAIGYNNRDVT